MFWTTQPSKQRTRRHPPHWKHEGGAALCSAPTHDARVAPRPAATAPPARHRPRAALRRAQRRGPRRASGGRTVRRRRGAARRVCRLGGWPWTSGAAIVPVDVVARRRGALPRRGRPPLRARCRPGGCGRRRPSEPAAAVRGPTAPRASIYWGLVEPCGMMIP